MNSSSVKLLDLRGQVILLVSMSVLLFSQFATAQGSWMYLKDQFTSPAYEGWWPNEDGSYKLFFGYMNTNWEQHYDVPIGPGNYFNIVEAGALDDLEINAFDFAEADQGQEDAGGDGRPSDAKRERRGGGSCFECGHRCIPS